MWDSDFGRWTAGVQDSGVTIKMWAPPKKKKKWAPKIY